MTCVEVDPGKYYRAEFSGLMTGHVTTRFIPQKDGILMDHPLTVTAVNRWVYLYYWLFLRPPHLPFMAWRYSMLRKNLIKEREIKKLKSKD
ncbi:hypothetical protein [Dehalobacterium formicoaceticum]|nr:hypothetical protein [Dehalobacterium formicoaceticum]